MRYPKLTRIIIFSICIFQFSPIAYGGGYPCNPETSPLMTLKSSWHMLYNASIELPDECFDGYFAEGISDTLVRKMGLDWPGFLNILKMHQENKRFMELIIRSINATVNSEDVRVVDELARTSCVDELKQNCAAISKKAAEALKELAPFDAGDAP
jgi:hypothetical protein